MPESKRHHIPPLRFHALTRLYPLLMRGLIRESTFKTALVEQAGIADGHRVLDLGCGTGRLTRRIRKKHRSSAVVGLDADETALAMAREESGRSGVRVAWHRATATRLPYRSDTFDRVVSSLVFHHLFPADKRRALEEVRRVLRPDGELHIVDWGRPQDPVMHSLFTFVRLLDGFEPTRAHVQGRLPSLIEETGFEEVQVRDRFRTIVGSLSLIEAQTA